MDRKANFAVRAYCEVVPGTSRDGKIPRSSFVGDYQIVLPEYQPITIRL